MPQSPACDGDLQRPGDNNRMVSAEEDASMNWQLSEKPWPSALGLQVSASTRRCEGKQGIALHEEVCH